MRRPRQLLGRLYATYQEVNDRHFASLLPMVPIRLERTMRQRGQTNIVAYLWTDDFVGQPRYLAFGEKFALTAPWHEVEEVLRHEMVHVWQSVAGYDDKHGPQFRAMAKRLGIPPGAVVD